MTPQEEAQRMIDELGMTLAADRRGVITLLAAQIQRVRELEERLNTLAYTRVALEVEKEALENSLAEQLKTGEALLVEKNERVEKIRGEIEQRRAWIEHELAKGFRYTGAAVSRIKELDWVLSLFPASNSQQKEKEG